MSGQVWGQLTGMNIDVLLTSNDRSGLLFIDSLGRRPLLMYGAIIMPTWLFGVSCLMGVHGHYVPSVDGNLNIRWSVPSKPAARAIIACNYLFVAQLFHHLGPGIGFTCPKFPLKRRAIGNGFCGAWNWIFNFALVFFVAPAFQNIQWKTYLLFAAFCRAMANHVFLMFPETKGKTLEEIDIISAENI
ncbi:general substrate transporter [Lipomyces orientalis]|uniref:General substrate transporter n=1 Tax=Lipomyces orientalis TaxID=1233043 RepID=A0ACC3TDB6_9ASCO